MTMRDGNKKPKNREGERGKGYRKHLIDKDREREADEELLEGRRAWVGVPGDYHDLCSD